MNLKIGSNVEVKYSKLYITSYDRDNHLFAVSHQVKDQRKQRMPSTVNTSRFSIPASFLGIPVNEGYYIPEAMSYPYRGRVYEDDHFMIMENGRKYFLREDPKFTENGVYYLVSQDTPKPYGGSDWYSKQAPWGVLHIQEAENYVRTTIPGSDIYGECIRILSYIIEYETTERGNKSKRVKREIEYYDSISMDSLSLNNKIVEVVIGRDDFVQWGISINHLKIKK